MIENISKTSLNENDILIVSVDCGQMNSHQIRKYLDNLLAEFKEKLHLDEDRLMIVPKNIDLSVLTISKEEII